MTALPWHTFTPDGLCIAMLHELPDDTSFSFHEGGLVYRKRSYHRSRGFVIVVAWPDGTTPTPPADDDGWIYTDDAEVIAEALDALRMVESHPPGGWERADNYSHTYILWAVANGYRFRIAR